MTLNEAALREAMGDSREAKLLVAPDLELVARRICQVGYNGKGEVITPAVSGVTIEVDVYRDRGTWEVRCASPQQ